jgi:hypothetical protein
MAAPENRRIGGWSEQGISGILLNRVIGAILLWLRRHLSGSVRRFGGRSTGKSQLEVGGNGPRMSGAGIVIAPFFA